MSNKNENHMKLYYWRFKTVKRKSLKLDSFITKQESGVANKKTYNR